MKPMTEAKISLGGWITFALLLIVAVGLVLVRPMLLPTKSAVTSFQVEGGLGLGTLYHELNYDLSAFSKENISVPQIYVRGFPKGWDNSLKGGQKKTLFYQSILPLILTVNREILDERERFSYLISHGNLSEKQKLFLKDIGKRYRFKIDLEKIKPSQIKEALRRIDTIPVSMGLGQAAYESGYATSRFAAEGNALFGQWRWGKGLVPKNQRTGMGDYRIATFPSPLGSVRAYALNLNSHKSYRGFRLEREKLRDKGETPFSGKSLINTLEAYSERGMVYVETLRGMIEKNNLWIFDPVSLGKGPIQEVEISTP
ncbi:MAG: glucosaminidase domain-containing protein [Alphaproteobacteria bacterium]|nr:glucosaminidase domain-containing protein [Alphaproteobacteria bacterium]